MCGEGLRPVLPRRVAAPCPPPMRGAMSRARSRMGLGPPADGSLTWLHINGSQEQPPRSGLQQTPSDETNPQPPTVCLSKSRRGCEVAPPNDGSTDTPAHRETSTHARLATQPQSFAVGAPLSPPRQCPPCTRARATRRTRSTPTPHPRVRAAHRARSAALGSVPFPSLALHPVESSYSRPFPARAPGRARHIEPVRTRPSARDTPSPCARTPSPVTAHLGPPSNTKHLAGSTRVTGRVERRR